MLSAITLQKTLKNLAVLLELLETFGMLSVSTKL